MYMYCKNANITATNLVTDEIKLISPFLDGII